MKELYCSLVCILIFGLMVIISSGENATPQVLTLKEAQALAVQHHPRISAAELRTLAARQITREARSTYFPTIVGYVTSAGTANDNTRLGAGGLNNPTVFERNAEGLILNQLITDFGRTANLTASSKAHARAEEQNAEATRAQILLEVTAAYFGALQAQSVLRVAEQTVTTRQLLLDQVSTLASNQLKSDLDVSFAKVSVEEGKLLLSGAENDLQAALARLSTLLGYQQQQSLRLLEEPMSTNLVANVSPLLEDALRNRPELLRLRYERDAGIKFAKAEKKLHYPSVAAIGAAGVIPVGDERLPDNYAAAAVNITFPFFNGMLYSSRAAEAELKAKATEENLRDQENNVIRDVRIAWLNANNSFERVKITERLLENASQAYELAQSRYKIGSSSIVELSQAELNKTSAEIAKTNARYESQIQEAILNYQTGQISKPFSHPRS